jgi:hypothetical protein
MRRKLEALGSRIEYIDPADCGSTIGFSIVRGRRLSATIDLADCTHKIQWYFYGTEDGVSKIDRAISVLEDFRVQWLAVCAKVRKPRPKRR